MKININMKKLSRSKGGLFGYENCILPLSTIADRGDGGTGKLSTFTHRKIVKHPYSKIVKNPYSKIVNFFANKFITS